MAMQDTAIDTPPGAESVTDMETPRPGEPPGLRGKVIEALRTVHDPEIPVNIYDLGLIYRLAIAADGRAAIDMTLTTPNCPVADMIPAMVMEAVQALDEVPGADVTLVWEPIWSPERMSEEAKLALDMF